MEGWVIVTKIGIVFYAIVNCINMKNIAYVVLALLLYIALNVYMYMLSQAKKVRMLSVLIFFASLICVVLIDVRLIVLIPINLLEMCLYFNVKQYIGGLILIIPIFLLEEDVLTQYLIIYIMSYIIIKFYDEYNSKLITITKENDYLREKNYLLNKNLIKDTEYSEQLKYLSQLEERNKIAQEIHDNIGHTLAGSLMQLEAIKFIMEKDVGKSKFMIQNTIDVLREGMDNIRATLRNVKPPSEQMGINKLKLILSEFEIKSGIKTVLYYKGNLENVSVVYWKIMNESIKEILTNIIKYSKASEVRVNMEVLNKVVKLQVKDNGIGCSNIVKGIGINGIEERCYNFNGKVVVDGNDGFTIILLLPI